MQACSGEWEVRRGALVRWCAGWTCGVKTVLEKADSVDADAPIDRDGDDIDILVVVKQSRLRVASMT